MLAYEDGKVVAANAVNEDGEVVLATVDLEGKSIEEAGAIFTETDNDLGYFTPDGEKDTVYIDVESTINGEDAELQEKLNKSIRDYFNNKGINGSSALDPLYEETAKPLYSLCYTYMHNHHDSEDALSETYLTVVRNIDKYRGENGFNWLYTIAKNICLNMLRKNSRIVSVDYDDEETVNTLGLGEENAPQIYDESGIIALSEKVLNENEFRIVILHAVNDVKFKDIAKIVGGLENTVRWQYNNAIKKVKNAYERRGSR